MPFACHEIHLVARPAGRPRADDFRLVETTLDLTDGQVLVRNTAMSVDPYMRPRMNDVPSYIPPFELNVPLTGGAVGRVIDSLDASIPVGTWVRHQYGWRDLAVLGGSQTTVIRPKDVPPSYYLGILGMPGLTAYAGLRAVADLRKGDVVFVSGAAGAVGSLVGQFARLLGASRVIGSAGSPAKTAYLVDDLGFDAALDYRSAPITDLLGAAAPDGIDVYFDNVGGDHFSAALDHLRLQGRVALCGTISGYSATQLAMIPDNLFRIVARRLRVQGFISSDYAHLTDEFEVAVARWLAESRIVYRETITAGLENAPEAFMSMLRGGNVGKAIVAL